MGVWGVVFGGGSGGNVGEWVEVFHLVLQEVSMEICDWCSAGRFNDFW